MQFEEDRSIVVSHVLSNLQHVTALRKKYLGDDEIQGHSSQAT
jgi:hypothetical protein